MALLQKRRPTSGCGLTTLMVACQQNLDIEVERLILKKPDIVSLKDRTGKTALHYCAENTNVSCADQILEQQDELLDAQDDEGYSSLHLAVISGNTIMVRFLIDKGADISCVDNEKHTCAHWATVCGELECLDILTEAGTDLSTPDIHGAYPVHYAAQMCGPNSEMGNSTKLGLLVLKKLLSKGVDVNCQDQDGRQPLLWAASAETRASKTYCPSGSSDAILSLIKAGADVTARDKDGLTALHCSASRGHLDCLETLITLCGSEVDALDSNGCSPLFYSVTLGHADCTHLLLCYGAKPNLQDRKGRSAAHCGASKGQLETSRILGQHGTNLWLRNNKGDTPLHEAVQSGRKELVEWFLEQLEGSVNVTNINGRTPLHISAITNNVELCKILMDHGAFINPIMKNSKGHLLTPLDAALHRGNRGCAKYLQLHGALPATKLVEKSEVYQSEFSPDQTTLSPETKHRIFKESAVQTENSQKDVDVQVHLRQRREGSDVDRVLESLGGNERTFKDSRKPIVAKVYVHTKRRDRRPIRRLVDETRRRSQQIQLTDSKHQRRAIPRLTNSTTSNTIKSATPTKDATDATVPEINEPQVKSLLVNETGSELQVEVASVEKLESEEVATEIDSAKADGLCACCADPYEDSTSLPTSCTCSCHQRIVSPRKSIVEEEVVEEKPELCQPEEQEQIEENNDQEETLEVAALEKEMDEEQIQQEDGEETQENQPEECSIENQENQKEEENVEDQEEEKEDVDNEQEEQEITIEEKQEDGEKDDGGEEEDDDADEEEEREESPNIVEVHKDSSEEYHPSPVEHEPYNEMTLEERLKDYLPLDFDDHSPLSSLRSMESNVKDSGFSEDFDRGDASSETDDVRSSPKYRTRRKPVARFVVTSGAADAYPLNEDDEEDMDVERFALRSASLPTLHAKMMKQDSSPRLLGRLALTKEVQKTLRRYQLERRLFYELQELKRKQICGSTLDEEAILVDKMVERFRRYVLSPGMTDFRGPLTFYSFENYLYEQLKKLSMSCKIPKPKPVPNIPLRTYTTTTRINEEDPASCVCQTHMCHHIRRPLRHGSLYKSDSKDSSREIILPEITQPKRRSLSRIPTSNRSKSYDRSRHHLRPDAQLRRTPSRYDVSKSLPSLAIPMPRHLPTSLLSAICQRLGPDVHLDDTVVVELSTDDIAPKIRHAFTVREIREVVRQWEEASGRMLKPINLEKVITEEDEGPVTFEIRHGNEKNVFRLPTENLKDNKKWQVIFTIGKGQKNA